MKSKKEVKTSKKKEETRTQKIISFVDTNRKIFYGFIGGVLISAIVTTIIWPDRIAKLSDGTEPVAEVNGEKITADTLYEDMKEYYSVDLLIDRIDNMILSEMYEETDEMKNEIEKTAQNYYSTYEAYGYTKEAFLESQGLSSHDDFIKILTLSYRRNEYYNEYAEGLVTEKEINNYYEDKVFGDINSKHILVAIDDDMADEDAKKLAEEIIGKLNDGKTFDEVKEEYNDKITYEELGYQPFNANLQESYMNALVGLKNEEYTTEPVKTTYGYHVIYRIDQKEKPSLEDIKDTIISELATEKKNADENMYYKALAKLREEKELVFYDTVMESEYNDYLKEYK